MQQPLSIKQLEFIQNATRHWNIAHGAVSTGKTICTTLCFFHAVDQCPDSEIAMIGKTSTTIFNNVINLLFECEQLALFKPFCTWLPSRHELKFKDKTITTYGAKDEGSAGLIQGRSLSLVYCDEMTLYPDSLIYMIDTRLRKPHSKGYASMNPSYPTHILKQWIDKAEEGDKNYYALHFTLNDNPYLGDEYKDRIRNSLSGVFYQRNYLGLWCLAEGAIFDFFDRRLHCLDYIQFSAEYYIVGIDYGTVNAFCALLIGVNTGRWQQHGPKMWVEKELFWDPKVTKKQKTNAEYAYDLERFLDMYPVKAIYLDPSAEAFQVELNKKGVHVAKTNNDVEFGIQVMTTQMQKGNLFIHSSCKNLIKEVETYVWDAKKAEKGYDEPLKKDDHAVDAMRYAVASHKIPIQYHGQDENFGRTLGFRPR